MGFRYIMLIKQGEIKPALATWTIFVVSVILSFQTYWSTGKKSIIANIANATDVVAVIGIFTSILIFGKGNLTFNLFEIYCLAASFGILIFWKTSKKHTLSNILLQVIMTVAYLPTFYRLWFATTNTESFLVWSIWIIGTSASLITSILYKDTLGILYASRAFVLTAIVIALMVRLTL